MGTRKMALETFKRKKKGTAEEPPFVLTLPSKLTHRPGTWQQGCRGREENRVGIRQLSI